MVDFQIYRVSSVPNSVASSLSILRRCLRNPDDTMVVEAPTTPIEYFYSMAPRTSETVVAILVERV